MKSEKMGFEDLKLLKMFPLQRRDELVFGTLPSVSQYSQLSGKIILRNQVLDHALPPTKYNNTLKPFTSKNVEERKRKGSNDDECNINKRVMHRENERQRRQEMANLYSAIRSLLPLEYIKGKRSVSDHMQAAVNYIKHKQKNMQELKLRRDRLCNLSGRSKIGRANSSGDTLLNYVMVNPGRDGIEILISSGFGLSRVLEELMARGFNVVSCVSTKENERFLHRIHVEAIDDLAHIDFSSLQEKLNHLIN